MLPGQRRDQIARRVAEEGAVSVAELSRLFGVAEETIRRDLKALESAGVLRRTHGGALRVPGALSRAAPASERLGHNHELKEAIARAALEMVHDGDTILLDSGTTTLALAKLLAAKRELVVVTHNLRIATQLAQAPHISVNVLGGNLRSQELALVGPDTLRALGRMRVDKAFMACAGLDMKHGATVSDVLEADVKRAMIHSADQVVLLADHTKWERRSLVAYAGLDQFNALVSDSGLPPPARELLGSLGVDVIIGEPEHE